MGSIRAWLGLDSPAPQPDAAPLRETLDALDHLEPERARFLAAFAYLLGRVAHADQHVSPEETAAMSLLTDLLTGASVLLSSGPAADAILASCAIPGAFPPVQIGDRYLIDGAVASNTPVMPLITKVVMKPSVHSIAG